MDLILKYLFVIMLAVFSLYINISHSVNARASKYLKEEVEIAVHDSALFQDVSRLSKGEIVFDSSKSLSVFKSSFSKNTGLSESQYKIVEFQIFDHSNTTFPKEFKSTKVDFEDTFQSPTIIAVVEAPVNSFFGNTSDKKVRRLASYTYKVNEEQLQIPNMEIVEGIVANEKGLYWVVPFTKNLTSPFNPSRVHPITGKVKSHNGMDIAAANITNKPVVAALKGKVLYAGVMGGYGNVVIIDHGNGFETRYAHLNAINVSSNQLVQGGQIIGLVGSTGDSTGAHLHYETRVDGTPVNPLKFYPNL